MCIEFAYHKFVESDKCVNILPADIGFDTAENEPLQNSARHLKRRRKKADGAVDGVLLPGKAWDAPGALLT